MHSCDKCRFYAPHPSSTLKGECRARPPVVMDGDGSWGYFPRVYSDSWCGEYKQKDGPDVSAISDERLWLQQLPLVELPDDTPKEQ
jgi:hypothetical protein